MADPSLPPPHVRPKLLSAPNKGAADRGAKRKSAQLGNDHLAKLLEGGLLSVPNVDVEVRIPRESANQGRSRSLRKAAIGVLVFLAAIFGIGGGGFVFVSKYQDQLVVDQMRKAGRHLDLARPDDFRAALEALNATRKYADGDSRVEARTAFTMASELLIYGSGSQEEAQNALALATDAGCDAPDEACHLEWAMAKAAMAMTLFVVFKDEVDFEALVDRVSTLAEGVQGAPLVHWLWARSAELAGRYDLALEIYQDLAQGQAKNEATQGEDAPSKKADSEKAKGNEDEDGDTLIISEERELPKPDFFPLALIALADRELDSGRVEKAVSIYDRVIKAVPGHPWALAGRALAGAENEAEALQIMEDVNVRLSEDSGPHVEAFKSLALAVVYSHLEDYEKLDEELSKAMESAYYMVRFQARVGILLVNRGRIAEALTLRRGLPKDVGAFPILRVLDGALGMSQGKPKLALETLGQHGSVTARLLRGRAYLDLGKPAQASKEFEAVVEIAPEDVRAIGYVALSRIVAGESKKSFTELTKLARRTISNFPRYILGEAAFHMRRFDDARRDLEASLEQNPLAYRAQVRLAYLYRRDKKYPEAEKFLDAAIKQAPGYLPARAELGRLHLALGRVKRAKVELEAVVDSGQALWEDEKAYAEALVRSGDKKGAVAALRRAVQKGGLEEELIPIADEIGPGVAEGLGLVER